MDYRNLVPVEGLVVNVANMGDDCCNSQVSLRTNNGIVNMVVSGSTYVINNIRLRPGMRVTAFYDSSLPVPLIFPPRYQAALITAVRPQQQAVINFFDRNLLAEDGSLQLNLGNRSNISTVNGQPFPCNPAEHVLLVYYTATTRSIPPQTTPDRIVVLCK